MIWLQKQPTNALGSLEECLAGLSEKEQADYRMIFQELTRQGWSAETVLQGLFVANGQRPDAVINLDESACLVGGSAFCQLWTYALKNKTMSAESLLDLVLERIGFSADWSGTVEERQDYLGRFSPDLSPDHPFWSEFSGLVRQVLKKQANAAIWYQLHPIRYLFSIQQAYWVREHFGGEGRSDREALLAYLSQLKPSRIDWSNSARLHNKAFVVNKHQVRHEPINCKILVDFHSEFILSERGNFVLIGEGDDSLASLANGASFNYARANNKEHGDLDMAPVSLYDPAFRKQALARKKGRFQAAIYFAGKPLHLWPRLWYYHYANPRGLYARAGRSQKYYVKQAGKLLKNELKSRKNRGFFY